MSLSPAPTTPAHTSSDADITAPAHTPPDADITAPAHTPPDADSTASAVSDAAPTESAADGGDASGKESAHFMRQVEQSGRGGQGAAILLVPQNGWAVLPLVQMDPARKLLAALLFAVGVSLVRHPALSACALVFPLILCILGRVPFLSVLRRLVPVLVFCALLWLTLPLGLRWHADTFAQVGPFYLRTAGVWMAFAITAKAVAIAATLLLLAGTTSVTGNARALLRLRVPEKFVTLLLLTYTSLYLAHKEAGRLFDAARLRGFPRRNRYRTYAWLLGMLVLRAVDRSARVQKAMRLRGFQGRFPLLSSACAHSGPSSLSSSSSGLFTRLSGSFTALIQTIRTGRSISVTRSARLRAYGFQARHYRTLSPVFQAGAKARAMRYHREIAEAVVLGTGVLSASLLVLFDLLVMRVL